MIVQSAISLSICTSYIFKNSFMLDWVIMFIDVYKQSLQKTVEASSYEVYIIRQNLFQKYVKSLFRLFDVSGLSSFLEIYMKQRVSSMSCVSSSRTKSPVPESKRRSSLSTNISVAHHGFVWLLSGTHSHIKYLVRWTSKSHKNWIKMPRVHTCELIILKNVLDVWADLVLVKASFVAFAALLCLHWELENERYWLMFRLLSVYKSHHHVPVRIYSSFSVSLQTQNERCHGLWRQWSLSNCLTHFLALNANTLCVSSYP